MKINFEKANEVLREEGMMPFPFEEVEVPDGSKEAAQRAIDYYADLYGKWMWKQWEMKNKIE